MLERHLNLAPSRPRSSPRWSRSNQIDVNITKITYSPLSTIQDYAGITDRA
jgi:hypothetical protein